MSENIILTREQLIEILEEAFEEGWSGCHDLKESACLHILEEFLEKNPSSSSNNNSPPVADFVDVAAGPTTFNLENVTINNNVPLWNDPTIYPLDWNSPNRQPSGQLTIGNQLSTEIIQTSVLSGAANLGGGYLISNNNENRIH